MFEFANLILLVAGWVYLFLSFWTFVVRGLHLRWWFGFCLVGLVPWFVWLFVGWVFDFGFDFPLGFGGWCFWIGLTFSCCLVLFNLVFLLRFCLGFCTCLFWVFVLVLVVFV